MSSLNFENNSQFSNLTVPKLHDDGSNWADYKPRLQKAMGAKGLWRHVEGKATALKPYILVKGIQVLQDGKIPATEEQIETKEMRLMEFKKCKYFAQHIILSTTSTRLRAKIKDLTSAKDVWEVVKSDATMKSTLYLLNAEEQLANMKLYDDEDSQTHLSEIKHHFDLMLQQHNNLIYMGSTISNSRFNTIIMTSLPESYRPTLQTITAAKRANLALGKSSKVMKADDLIAFLIEEAQHRVIIEERARVADLH